MLNMEILADLLTIMNDKFTHYHQLLKPIERTDSFIVTGADVEYTKKHLNLLCQAIFFQLFWLRVSSLYVSMSIY